MIALQLWMKRRRKTKTIHTMNTTKKQLTNLNLFLLNQLKVDMTTGYISITSNEDRPSYDYRILI